MKSIYAVILLHFSITLWSQDFPIEWGDIPREHLEMTSCPVDADARAFILDDHCIMHVVNAGSVFYEFRHIRRIKILSEAGMDEADIVIPYRSAGGKEVVLSIRAQTISPEGVSRGLRKEDFFTETLTPSYSALTFSFRNVEVGSVLEYEYHLKCENIGLLRKWYFQHALPIRTSTLQVITPLTAGYSMIAQGGQFLHSSTSQIRSPGSSLGSGSKENLTVFSLQNAVGLEEEPYSIDMDRYRISVEFQLDEIFFGTRKVDHIPTWKELYEIVRVHDNVGDQYGKQRNYKKILEAANPIIKGDATTDEKIEQLHQLIAGQVAWNGYWGLQTSENLDDLFEGKSAVSSAPNYMFYALLQELGVPSQVVFVGLHNDGPMYEEYPIIRQFSHAIVMLEYKGQTIFADIHHAMAPLGMMRSEAHNFKGWVATDKDMGWVDIPSPVNERKFFAQLTLADSLQGDVISSLSAFDALRFRRSYNEEEPTELQRALEEFSDGEVEITSSQVRYFEDIAKDVQERITFRNAVEADLVLINVFSYSAFRENVLKQEKRNYPVDFDYLIKENIDVQIEIDTNMYEVLSLPRSTLYSLKEGDAYFRILADTHRNTLRLAFKLEIPRQHYSVEEYRSLRELFVRMEEFLKEPVVCKRL